ncbi:metal ABC transporter ATP-binding protein [Desulfovibrio litoralis]|uniref:Zinc transport system ATP-binding protein n=1 Tax=Desulfovibrio litoralis DSM 11393 TaxID=1121455 RepID=A0A1M7TKL7_9BACT|nr:metal ABC transporter ATP-binding protein [Desulfovibrio litoralis]SHN71255.1 zinc transport system ATP-binding protein [Desulfovibrio litoralis DSM 11393]
MTKHTIKKPKEDLQQNIDNIVPPKIAVELENVFFSYQKKDTSQGTIFNSFENQNNYVLNNINYSLEQGSLLAVLGPNGGGKTTLLRLLLGFLEPDSGKIKIFGKDPSASDSLIGYVPQSSTLRLDFPVNVENMVLMGAAKREEFFSLKHFGQYWSVNKKNKEKAGYFLNQLGLGSHLKRKISELSGGELQRALIARALMGWNDDKPFLLLLDEPTASIDPAGKFCFYEFLHTLKNKITSIVVSHDLTTASNIFDHLVIINKTLIEAKAVTQSPEQPQSYIPVAFSTNINLETIFGKHEHDCPCPVASFIKATKEEK